MTSDAETSNRHPLEGMRVLELAHGIAGAYAGKMLCDAGADVVKLEPPDGDPLRRKSAVVTDATEREDSTLFRFLNASKRSVSIDEKAGNAEERLIEFARAADVVIEDTRGGHLAAFGLSAEPLLAANPRLVVTSISPWGLSGPFADRPATPFTLEALCGSSLRRELPGRAPVASGGHIAEFATGVYGAAGALAAWVSARRSGRGQTVDVSVFESVVTTLTTFFGLRGQWIKGPMQAAADSPSIERASDGWVGLSTYTGQQWTDFCALIERPDLAAEERFRHASERFAAGEELAPAFFAWTGKHTVEEIVELASLMRVPSAPVLDAQGALACDHYQARGVFVENPHGFRQPRPPYRLGEGTLRPIGRAPAIGEHSAEATRLWPERSATGSDPESPPTTRPYEGLRVIDLTAFWAGPAATTFLSDMGADVVKIESIQRPDGMRFIGATGNQPLWEWSEVFAGANCGKRSVTLNLDSEDGREILLQLLADADVLAENASPRVLDNFGLDIETLLAHNPRLMVLRMPAWGLDGPWRDRPGFAANIEQACGIAAISGYEDAPVCPVACDPIGGTHAAFALMVALEVRERTGRGQLVEASLVEPALNVAAQSITEFDAYGQLPRREGNRAPHAAPQGMYRCLPPRDERDPEWLAVSVEGDEQWLDLRAALGDPAWCREAGLATLTGRREAQDLLDRELSAWCATRRATDAEATLLAAGVPAAAARNCHFLLPNDQLDARGFFQAIEHPMTGVTRYPSLPMVFSAFGPGLKKRPPPTLGQHNEDVLDGELGLSRERIDELERRKVIGTRPDF